MALRLPIVVSGRSEDGAAWSEPTETDDISTLLVGPPDVLFAAMRDLFVFAARSGEHCVLSAAVSRGCPGEPDDPGYLTSKLLSSRSKNSFVLFSLIR